MGNKKQEVKEERQEGSPCTLKTDGSEFKSQSHCSLAV